MRSWLAVTLMAVLTVSGARADRLPAPRIQVNGSLGIPVTPESFADGYNLGFGGGIGAEFPVSASFKISGTVDFTTFALDGEDWVASQKIVPPPASIVGGEASILYVSGNLKWNVLLPRGSLLRPYLVFGGGYFRMAADDIILPGSTVVQATEDVLGLHTGWGIDIAFGSSISLFFDALYIIGSTEGKSNGYLPVRVGLAFDLIPQI